MVDSSLPQEARRLFGTGAASAVVLIPYKRGQVAFVGWDWYDAAPRGSQDGGWLGVLDCVLDEVTRTPPIAVFDNPLFVDTDDSIGSESDNLQASLAELSPPRRASAVTDIDPAGLAAALSGREVLVIPELEIGDLAASLVPEAVAVLQSFVANGGGLVIHGSFYAPSLLSTVFGFSVTQVYDAASAQRQAAAGGTACAAGPLELPWNDGTSFAVVGSLPPGALTLYGQETTPGAPAGAVVLIPYGAGHIAFLGWDWFDAVPRGSQDGGWLEVLDCVLEELTPNPCDAETLSGTLPISIAGDTTGRPNGAGTSCGDGGGAAPDQSFRFTAPSPGTYTIDTFGSSFDTILSIRSGCMGTEIACNDDDLPPDRRSRVDVSLAALETVIITVDGFGGAFGPFSLNINHAGTPTPTPTPPPVFTPTPPGCLLDPSLCSNEETCDPQLGCITPICGGPYAVFCNGQCWGCFPPATGLACCPSSGDPTACGCGSDRQFALDPGALLETPDTTRSGLFVSILGGANAATSLTGPALSLVLGTPNADGVAQLRLKESATISVDILDGTCLCVLLSPDSGGGSIDCDGGTSYDTMATRPPFMSPEIGWSVQTGFGDPAGPGDGTLLVRGFFDWVLTTCAEADCANHFYPDSPNLFAFTTTRATAVQQTDGEPITLAVPGEPFSCESFGVPGSGGMLAAPMPAFIDPTGDMALVLRLAE
jgi:hypothetical protein